MKSFIFCFAMLTVLPSFASTLSEVLQYAVKNAPQFAQSEYMTKSQIASLKKVLAIYDTSASLSASRSRAYSSSYGSSVITTGGAATLSKNVGAGVDLSVSGSSYKTDLDVYSSSVKVSADIDLLENLLGKMDRNTVLASDHSVKKLNIALEEMRDGLIYGIIEQYLATLSIEKQLIEDKLILKNLLELERATLKKVKLGASENRDLLQVKARRINNQIQIEALEQALNASLNSLKALTGGKEFSSLEWPDFGNGVMAGESFTLKKLATERDKLKLEFDSAELGMLPTLKLSGSIGKESDSSADSYFGGMDENSSSVALTLSFPLGNTEASEEKKRAHFSLLENEMETRKERLEFERDLSSYRRKITSYQKQTELTGMVRGLQDKRYKEEFHAYKQGRSQINDIITAHNDLINARLSYITTKKEMISVNYAWLNLNGLLSKQLGLGN